MPFLDFSDHRYLEKIGTTSPWSLSIVNGESRITVSYLWEPEVFDDLIEELDEAITEVLGGVEVAGDGSLHRDLPKACPVLKRSYCFADKIVSIRGLGVAEDQFDISDESENEGPPLVSAFAAYPVFQFDIEFVSRPYSLFSDDSVELETIEWYDEDNNPVDSVVANEQIRWVSWRIEPGLEIAYATHGQLAFRVESGDPPDGFTAPGHPRIPIRDSMLVAVWHGVPESYIWSENSYLRSFQGTVNQDTFDADGIEYPPGSLLYMGCTVTQWYPPPLPERITWAGTTSFSSSKLVSIELKWKHTERVAADDPPDPEPFNRNWVRAGHNLLPWISGRTGGSGFYAVGMMKPATVGADPTAYSDDEAYWTPPYPSRPMSLLFTDPDYPYE